MNTRESIDKFLTEKLFGECWHRIALSKGSIGEIVFGGQARCGNCGKLLPRQNVPYAEPINKTFHSPDGFFRLWKKMQEREDWFEFCATFGVADKIDGCVAFMSLETVIINHQTFPRLVAEWLGWKENK